MFVVVKKIIGSKVNIRIEVTDAELNAVFDAIRKVY